MERRHGAKLHVLCEAKPHPPPAEGWCRRESPERSEDRAKPVEILDGFRENPAQGEALTTQNNIPDRGEAPGACPKGNVQGVALPL